MNVSIIIVLLIIFILLAVTYCVIGNYFYNMSLNSKSKKNFVKSELELPEEEKQLMEKELDWLKKKSQDSYITSTNNGNLKLHAYEIKQTQESDLWVIVIHGYMGDASGMTVYAKQFYQRGYNVLMPDLRGHGLSEGNYVGMGWHDRLDIIDWINYIIKNNAKAKIIIFGISMGATTTMMTIGEKLPTNVKFAISDCGYSSVWEEFSYQLKRLFKLPSFPVLYAANRTCKKKTNYSFKEASAVEQLKKSKIPILFIHGDKDDFVPYKMLESVYDAAPGEKEKLVVEGATHGISAAVNPELYWKTVDDFTSKHLQE